MPETGQIYVQIEELHNGKYMLTVKSKRNERGILYRISGVLFVYGWNILRARAKSAEDGGIEDAFLIEPVGSEELDAALLSKIENDINEIFAARKPMLEYLQQFPHAKEFLNRAGASEAQTQLRFRKRRNTSIVEFDLVAPDKPGLLLLLTQALYIMCYDIIHFEGETIEENVHDHFIVCAEDGSELHDKDIERLRTKILEHL